MKGKDGLHFNRLCGSNDVPVPAAKVAAKFAAAAKLAAKFDAAISGKPKATAVPNGALTGE